MFFKLNSHPSPILNKDLQIGFIIIYVKNFGLAYARFLRSKTLLVWWLNLTLLNYYSIRMCKRSARDGFEPHSFNFTNPPSPVWRRHTFFMRSNFYGIYSLIKVCITIITFRFRSDVAKMLKRFFFVLTWLSSWRDEKIQRKKKQSKWTATVDLSWAYDAHKVLKHWFLWWFFMICLNKLYDFVGPFGGATSDEQKI